MACSQINLKQLKALDKSDHMVICLGFNPSSFLLSGTQHRKKIWWNNSVLGQISYSKSFKITFNILWMFNYTYLNLSNKLS